MDFLPAELLKSASIVDSPLAFIEIGHTVHMFLADLRAPRSWFTIQHWRTSAPSASECDSGPVFLEVGSLYMLKPSTSKPAEADILSRNTDILNHDLIAGFWWFPSLFTRYCSVYCNGVCLLYDHKISKVGKSSRVSVATCKCCGYPYSTPLIVHEWLQTKDVTLQE